jgi:hypothetical protein
MACQLSQYLQKLEIAWTEVVRDLTRKILADCMGRFDRPKLRELVTIRTVFKAFFGYTEINRRTLSAITAEMNSKIQEEQ